LTFGYNELEEYLREQYYHTAMEPDEMTTEDCAHVMGISKRAVAERLKLDVEKGTITARKARMANGNIAVVYRLRKAGEEI
jgi:predicted ArsR family transcriptional regulator